MPRLTDYSLSSTRPAKVRTAFTLFELVLVLAVIIIFAAIVFPSFEYLSGTRQLTRAADMVQAAWSQARAHAIDEGRAYRFAIVPNKGNYRIAPNDPEFWSSDTPPAPDDPDYPFLIMSDTLPKGLRFNAGGNADPDQSGPSSLAADQVPIDAWSTKAIFQPDGTAKSDVEVVFATRGNRELHLRLRALTGAVTARWYTNREKGQP